MGEGVLEAGSEASDTEVGHGCSLDWGPEQDSRSHWLPLLDVPAAIADEVEIPRAGSVPLWTPSRLSLTRYSPSIPLTATFRGCSSQVTFLLATSIVPMP